MADCYKQNASSHYYFSISVYVSVQCVCVCVRVCMCLSQHKGDVHGLKLAIHGMEESAGSCSPLICVRLGGLAADHGLNPVIIEPKQILV